MPPSPIDPELERVLAVAIESADRLEILLTLRREQPKTFTAKSLRMRLAIPAPSIDTHLALLCGRGYLGVTIGNDLVYAYRPISQKLDTQVADIAVLWATRRADVEASLRERRESDPVRIFADAFRLRRTGDGDGDGDGDGEGGDDGG